MSSTAGRPSGPRRRSSRLPRRVAPLALFLAATCGAGAALAAPAADPLAGEFKSAAKTALKALKLQVNGAVAAAAAELKAIPKDYASGALDATQAVDAVVAAVTAQRDVIEDAALAAASQLSGDGAALLLDAGVTEPGADFQAGGRGVWDDALFDIEALLDKADLKLDLALGKFDKSLTKAAPQRDAAIDVRWRLPPHGEQFWEVSPPFETPPPIGVAEGGSSAPHQVLIAVRVLETTAGDRLGLGIRGGPGAVDVVGSSSAAESVLLGSPSPDTSGTATGSFDLVGLLNDSFLTVELAPDAAAGPDARVTLSLPHLLPPAQDTGAIEKGFKQNVKLESKFFAKVTAEAVAALGGILNDQVKAVSSGQATAALALELGLGSLRDTRDEIAFWHLLTTNSPATQGALELAAAGVDDGGIPPDMLPDTGGFLTGSARKWASTLAARQASASKKLDTFIDKVLALADKQGESVGLNGIAGRNRPVFPKLLTLSSTPPADESTRPHLTDAFLLLVDTGTPQLTAQLLVQCDAELVPTPEATYTNGVDGTIVIGDMTASTSGVAQTQVPVLGNIPILKQLFRAGETTDKPHSLIVLVNPTIVGATP